MLYVSDTYRKISFIFCHSFFRPIDILPISVPENLGKSVSSQAHKHVNYPIAKRIWKKKEPMWLINFFPWLIWRVDPVLQSITVHLRNFSRSFISGLIDRLLSLFCYSENWKKLPHKELWWHFNSDL